jgi:hypothetical protein
MLLSLQVRYEPLPRATPMTEGDELDSSLARAPHPTPANAASKQPDISRRNETASCHARLRQRHKAIHHHPGTPPMVH